MLRIIACLFLWRLLIAKTPIRVVLILLSILSCLLSITSVLQIFLICRPFAAQWDPHILGQCGDQVISFITLEITGVVLDFGILILPIQPILNLQMRRSRKWRIITVLDANVV